MEKLDFRSGLGHDTARTHGHGPRLLISDLGQFDFEPESGRMRIQSLHPGVSLQRVQAKTGFDLIVPTNIPETPAPTAEELHYLRELIDPLGVRTLEMLSGATRKEKLQTILQQEMASTPSAGKS